MLADLAEHDIDIQAHGDAIRYRPRHAMTLDLLQRVQAHKSELLAVLDSDRALVELRRFVAALWQDHAWRQSWEDRFQQARYANLDSLGRVLGIVLDQAEQHHRRRD